MNTMRIEGINFQKNPNIGLFAFATDKFCLLNRFVKKRKIEKIKKILKVPVIRASALGTPLLGIFIAGNSKGLILSKNLYENEISHLRKNIEVLILDTEFTALGNLILANDNGCVISEKLKKHTKDIEDFLNVRTETGSISGLDLVGSLGICNNKGCLVHKGIKEREKKSLERILNVEVGVGTVNFGNSWVKSGLIVNSFGFLAGDQTSGPELGIISEALGFL
jgi:translation initiation factor 6